MHKWIVLKTIIKFTLKLTLKQLQHISVQSHHHQGAHYSLPDDGVTAPKYEGWNFNSGNYLFTTDTK